MLGSQMQWWSILDAAALTIFFFLAMAEGLQEAWNASYVRQIKIINIYYH